MTTPGAFKTPTELPAELDVLAAPVPGTLAGALERQGLFDRAHPTPLDMLDAWYRLDIAETPGPAILRFEGLAVIADVFWNGEKILASDSMFESVDVAVSLTGRDQLAICFRAIGPHLSRKGPRARWRPRMMRSQGLRLLRTTALGFMPGWCPDIVAVGPWRPVTLLRPGAQAIGDLVLQSRLDGNGTGKVSARFTAQGLSGEILLECAGRRAGFRRTEAGDWQAELSLPDIEPWWPATHGTPVLHAVTLLVDGVAHELGRTGFRHIAIDRGADGEGFALHVNGEEIFCRGAVWTCADIVDLPGDRAAYEPFLRKAADAGMNMIRIGGTMTYETQAFFDLCDELGILVWQDLMLANFDYPESDEQFLIHVKTEVAQLLRRHAASPSLAIVCGGSEMHQQGAMLGLPERAWRNALTTDILPAVCAEHLPHLAYVENSPSGGPQPFFVNTGIGHYYGVGAYMRPLDDARRANLRFATECLAFANVPDAATLSQHLPVPALHDPRWKARVPRDAGASWDFEDVREYYVTQLYGVDAARLRREDPERYLAFSRAAPADVMEASFSEWRRPASPGSPGSECRGGLVWTLQDLLPGPGWGVIDATGRPKSVFYALKRAFRPVQVLLSDEGVNGLNVHVLNETQETLDLALDVSCLCHSEQVVIAGHRDLALAPRAHASFAVTELFGAFFDTNYAYRFGPPSHDVTIARLTDRASGAPIADAFFFPLGRAAALREAALDATVTRLDETRWALDIKASSLAQSVTVDFTGWMPDDNGFHLSPLATKRVNLTAIDPGQGLPSGEISALDGRTRLQL